jgi:tetratricopeptide (TPR) repeat protein
MKGRAIFGDLVPYDQMWRTGANKNTMITFSGDVKIGGSDVKAGTYSIFTKPGAKSWEVYLYTDTENWGTPEKWNDAKVAAKVMATPTKLPVSMETFLINVGGIHNNGASIQMIWENTLVSFDIDVPTKATVQKSIDKMMAGPSNRDYYNMAGFYLDEKENLETALDYINKSISMDYEKFWAVRRKALIQAELGKYKDAIATAKRSIELAKEAGNEGYVNSNMKSIAKWTKM